MNKIVLTCFLILTFVVVIATIALAQGLPPDPPDPKVPIDGGLGILLSAGVVYGIHRYRKSRKR
jgi:hypothetical protein